MDETKITKQRTIEFLIDEAKEIKEDIDELLDGWIRGLNKLKEEV